MRLVLPLSLKVRSKQAPLRQSPLPVQGCPTYVEYFKEGDDVPKRLCPIHQGTFKQEARRALDGLLAHLGRKILDIFK